MREAVLGALAALAAAEPPDGSAWLYIMLGMMVAVGVALLGHGYWVWRRSRGPLQSADDVVRHAAEVSDPRRDGMNR